jgi:hypothetical protein
MQGSAPDEEYFEEHGECHREIDRLRTALREAGAALSTRFMLGAVQACHRADAIIASALGV